MEEINAQDALELKKEFSLLKKEVSEWRFKLNQLHSQKEEAFHGLHGLRDKIKSRASRIKSLKQERDNLTKQVKELKGEREKFNQQVKERAEEKREVSQKQKELFDKMEVREDPRKLRQLIERMETKIVTEVMPFTKEQQLNKKIKELKVQLKEMEKLGDVWKEMNTASADFSEVRRKAEESHHGVQTLAQQSQERHEEINKLFTELKELREQEMPLLEKYQRSKSEMDQLRKELEEKLTRVNELAKLLHEEEEKDYNTKVREKTTEVQEKLKKRQKLRTEDILAFQAMKE